LAGGGGPPKFNGPKARLYFRHASHLLEADRNCILSFQAQPSHPKTKVFFFYSDQTIEYRPINILPQQKQNDKDKQLPLLQQEKVNGLEEEFVAILNLCGTFFFHHQHLKAFVLKYRKTHRRGNTCKLTSC
jgi:hypothetical protein